MGTPRGQYSGLGSAQKRSETVAVAALEAGAFPPSSTLQQLRQFSRLLEPLAQEWTVNGRLRRLMHAALVCVGADYVVFGLTAADGGYEQFLFSPADRRGLAEMESILAAQGIGTKPSSITMPVVEGVLEFDTDEADDVAFLVAPLEFRQRRLGNLFVMSRGGAARFGPLDRQLVVSLCEFAAAGLESIEHYEESLHRQQWLQAAGDIHTRLVGTPVDELEVWQLIAANVLRLAQARTVTISVPWSQDAAFIDVWVAVGAGASDLVGQRYPAGGSIAALALSSSRGQLGRGGLYCIHELVDDSVDEGYGLGQVMAVPLVSSEGVRGAIVVSRRQGDEGFRPSDLSMAQDFATQAVVALERADAHLLQQHLKVLEDRERIARDLHDHVIQSLFATGLNLSSTLRTPRTVSPENAQRISDSIASLDATITQIRATIFDLQLTAPDVLTARVATLQVLAELEPLELPLDVHFIGLVDTRAGDRQASDLAAVVRESLTNVHKHARASSVVLTVEQDPHELAITVDDDGVGLGAADRRSGLANLRSRAARAGGSLTLDTGGQGGLRLRWTSRHSPVRV